ncbi:hypothetical protein CERSUDRAFT_119230 [Gelatoporia subvermispora B]|uniref:Uncharacterized protein n=1 Tax=Ceriporiopsis subvermispora (strain B) TaxID=914234 RepID=M2P936_CERS8|nr:hypothetical protein CERSUDRAFT_119230 [Gelatoporia subvermispora B]
MPKIPTLVSLFLLAATGAVNSSPCVTFDANFNLLAFGLDGKDWNAGTQDSWTSGSATDITTSGRPPFDGANTTCYLAQFFNAVYVMNGDASSPSSVHIYDAGTKSWSEQSVTTGNFDPSSFNAILDHDTNVFYALSNGELFFLDFGSLTAANSSALSWVDVEKAPYPAGYQPVMALAQNHIHFLDIPGVPAGDAEIFVIHFSFFQPDPQPYPLPDGSAFPATHGQATSFFQSQGVQQEFAFIPDDGSATYVINVETNTTQKYAGPTTKDAKATYAASITALVQMDSTGAVSFFPYQENDVQANSQAAWSKVSAIESVAPPSSSAAATPSGSSGAASGSGHPSASGSGSSASASATGNSAQNNGAAGLKLSSGMILGGVLGLVACLL